MSIKQLIFVVETDENTQSDNTYIRMLINQVYDMSDNSIKTQYVFMNGKGKYKKRHVLTKINSYINANNKGTNIVLYCFDTDRIDLEQQHIAFIDEVKKYCENNKYEFIWFCYDIENVFLGQSINKNEKKSTAMSFNRKMTKISNSFLQKMNTKNNKMSNHHSNILNVLDNYMKRKN